MTKVLVVDDSALMRRLLSGVLGQAGFAVDTARTGVEALERADRWRPDVITLDVNMPEMDGLTALSLLMQARPTPVVMVSSLTERGAQATFEALALGAVDFVAKPGGTISCSVDGIAPELVAKVRGAAQARVQPLDSAAARAAVRRGSRLGAAAAPARPAATPPAAVLPSPVPGAAPAPGAAAPPAPRRPGGLPDRRAAPAAAPARPGGPGPHPALPGLVLVGVSTGGPRTLEAILPRLPAAFPWPVLVAQHMPAHFTEPFARRMDGLCALRVRECADTQPLEPGTVTIARGGTDMVVAERLGRLVVQPRPESAAHPWHPSVDVLVESALRHLPAARLIGVQLTGMGHDGAEAMARLHRAGGRTVAEAQDTAVVFGMPQELIARGGASAVLPCGQIAGQILAWADPALPTLH